jgi:hypothetical protein
VTGALVARDAALHRRPVARLPSRTSRIEVVDVEVLQPLAAGIDCTDRLPPGGRGGENVMRLGYEYWPRKLDDWPGRLAASWPSLPT